MLASPSLPASPVATAVSCRYQRRRKDHSDAGFPFCLQQGVLARISETYHESHRDRLGKHVLAWMIRRDAMPTRKTVGDGQQTTGTPYYFNKTDHTHILCQPIPEEHRFWIQYSDGPSRGWPPIQASQHRFV